MAVIHVRVKSIEDKIEEFVENNPEPIYVDYSDELSTEQVDKILEGKSQEVRDEIEFNASSYGYGLDYYWERCREVTGASQDDIDDWLSESGFYPSFHLEDYDWTRLLRNTTVNISAIVPEAEWNFNSWAYGAPIDYSDVRESLKILGIDPYEFRDVATGGSKTMGEGKFKGWFPKLPNRTRKVDPKELYDNMCVLYDGMLHFCLGDLEEVAEVLEKDPKYVTFKKGTNIVMYDRLNGAGITEAKLLDDVKIQRKNVEFRNDTRNSYGVQACYGFVQGYWEEGGLSGSN